MNGRGEERKGGRAWQTGLRATGRVGGWYGPLAGRVRGWAGAGAVDRMARGRQQRQRRRRQRRRWRGRGRGGEKGREGTDGRVNERMSERRTWRGPARFDADVGAVARHVNILRSTRQPTRARVRLRLASPSVVCLGCRRHCCLLPGPSDPPTHRPTLPVFTNNGTASPA